MRFSVKTVWTLSLLSLLFFGCPGKDVQSNDASDSTIQGRADVPAVPDGASKPSLGGQTPQTANTIPFSGDKEKIKKKMEMITGAVMRLDTASAGAASISYKGGAFGGFSVVDWTFLFHKDQMMLAQVNYSDEKAEVTADSIYNALTKLLTRQYGEQLIDSENRISRPLGGYSDGAQEFIAKVGKSLPQDFRLWTASADGAYIITLNKVQWNTAGGPTFVHLAFYDRALSEDYFAGVGE